MPLISLTTTRRDGHLREPRALAHFLRTHHWPLSIATGQQVHRAKIAIVPQLTRAEEYFGVDGLITAIPDQMLGLFTADCVPVFLSADKERVVGILHAGWRGVQARIVAHALKLLKDHWGIEPRGVRFWVGPSIGACCFEVQWDVARYFPNARYRLRDRWRVDLAKALQQQVKRAGARWVPGRPSCTYHTRRYFSFRKNGTAERQVSLIMKKGLP